MFTRPAVPYGYAVLELANSERNSPFQHRSHS
jgi:hypothetical protein